MIVEKFDPEEFRKLLGGVIRDGGIDEFNNDLLRHIQRNVENTLSDGKHRIKIDNKEFLIYFKDDRVIAGVNIDNVEEYCQCSHSLSPFLNVLFKELGSDKKIRIGLDSTVIHDDDLYSLYDDFDDYKKDFYRLNKHL